MKFAAILRVFVGCICVAYIASCTRSSGNEDVYFGQEKDTMRSGQIDTATFGAGCFWCVEAVFQDLRGVEAVVSGYSGGHVRNPDYKEVSRGTTGHAEVCQIRFDPGVISYSELLEVFWKTHDPTTRDRQGNDVGPQYRSVIFYHSEEQRKLAEHYKKALDEAHVFDGHIVTEIVPYQEFFKAENYHQNYYNENGDQPYCLFVIKPKVDKVKKVFRDKLKPSAVND